jgi:hypothetical protein
MDTRRPYNPPEIWRSLQPQQVAWYCSTGYWYHKISIFKMNSSILNSEYRSLQPQHSKAVSSIAATRLATHLKGFGVEEQAGSTPGKGCADATFTLKTALQTLREHGQESWGVLFVDLVKAYDTVNREMLWTDNL